MTLILAVNGRESIWLLADRRLSFAGRTPRDDGHKIMFLETADGVAILGYAGLGATARGIQPADWMGSVLRGRNLSLEQSLGVLSEASKRQFPRHMVHMPGSGQPSHNIVVTAFVGDQARLYTIDLALTPNRKRFAFRYTRHVVQTTPSTPSRTPRVCIGGTGALYLLNDKKWKRDLLDIVKASDRGQVSPRIVTAHLANLNHEVHLGVTDKSVGPRCIVAWRHRKDGIHKGGGGHHFYTGTAREGSSASLPMIANGMDVRAIIGAIMPHITKTLEEQLAGKPVQGIDKAVLNAELARLPDKPNEDLP